MLDTSRRQVVAGSGERMRPGTAFGGAETDTDIHISASVGDTARAGEGRGALRTAALPLPHW